MSIPPPPPPPPQPEDTPIYQNDIGDFEKWLRGELRGIPKVVDAVGSRIYNSIAKQGASYPLLIFKVIPLDDNTGQGGLSVQTQVYCDIQIYSPFPHPETVDIAAGAVKTQFNETRGHIFNGWSIAIRHYRPISRVTAGAAASEHLVARGGTYKAWIARAA